MRAAVIAFGAPWSRSLIWISALTTALCLGVSVFLASKDWGRVSWAALLPLGIVVGAALFTIRGYEMTPEELVVRRLIWKTRVPLVDLKTASVEPGAMKGSLRLCGNGGLFSFTGYFWNRLLGVYRAYVTDPGRVVVLRCGGRTVVVSPSEPGEFVRALKLNS